LTPRSRVVTLALAVPAMLLCLLVCTAVAGQAQPAPPATAAARAAQPAREAADAGAVGQAGAEAAAEAGLAPPLTDAGPVAQGDLASGGGAMAAEQEQLSPEEQAFLGDMRVLTRQAHRLSGSEAGSAAADYIAGRLRRIGIADVYLLDMPVWQSRTLHCELQVGEQSVRLYPLRPNVVVNPVTPPEGLNGPLVYVGRGELADYGKRDVEGAIVVIDYDSFDNWERAFSLGASAVVFLGKGDEVPLKPKHAGVPSNQVRLYAPASVLEQIDLRQEHLAATVFGRVVWERRRGRNIIARVRGTEPGFASQGNRPEALVLAAHYDSYGVVPELSGGARGAANVAALLEAAGRFQRNPPRRDVLFMFLDNQGRGHQGAREVYAALQAPGADWDRLLRGHDRERRHVAAMRELLATRGLAFEDAPFEAIEGASVPLWLRHALRKEADYARDDVRKKVQVARLAAGGDARPESRERSVAELDAESLRWDQIRRVLHEDALRSFVVEQQGLAEAGGDGAQVAQQYQSILGRLRDRTLVRFERRLQELAELVEIDQQRQRLRNALGFGSVEDPTRIVLHVTYAFSDQGSTWGVVVGDWTNRLFAWRSPKADGDMPGYYGRVLNAIREVEPDQPGCGFDPSTLSDPNLGLSFAAGPFVASGAIAGAYGIYNVSLMTGYDGRPREGHPADTLSRLDWRRLRSQSLAATRLMQRLVDSKGISLEPAFKSLAENKLPSWAEGQSKGDYAALVVSGSLAEDRPAAGALVALWPGQKSWVRQAWVTLETAAQTGFFDPIMLESVDQNGRFRVLSFREDMHSEVMSIGAMFDEQGRLKAISTTEQQAQKLTEAMRVNLFTGSGGGWTVLRTYDTQPGLLKVLKASSDAFFRDHRALWGQLENHGFFYVSDQVVDTRIKLFQSMGPVALGESTEPDGFGPGLEPRLFSRGVALSGRTARDLWNLNEARLSKLRQRGIISADLELLHSRAHHQRESAETADSVALRQPALMRSAALSHRVYLPLRAAMDDLVHAIVVLLFLAIPFAFAMERLLVCATSIYGRIGGFILMFLITFGLLYWLHPGFAVASTPMIIFLAFAIVLLSSLVIYLVVRKFKTELRAIQGQRAGLHELEVSRTGTMLAAVGMGMSTMRRRPIRTLLTAITVVMLTFTILSFASLTRTVGVRSVYEGPLAEQTTAGILVRNLDYSEMPAGVLDMLRGEEGEGGLLAPQYWLVRKDSSAPRFSVTRTDNGESLTIDALLGLIPEQLERWPQLSSALGKTETQTKQRILRSGGVLLPAIVQEVLKLKSGDQVLLGGKQVEFGGVLDGPSLQRVRHLDNQSLLPVDFEDPTSHALGMGQADEDQEDELLVAEEVDRDFVHLSSDQVAVASAGLVRELGGGLHSITVHPGEGVQIVERGRRLAELVVMPTWAAGGEGVERLIFTVLTRVSGGLALLVPLLLGGLIIFGTLLGSISDRQNEIYTFSALGLSPGHVGVLFFAEATVYAVVGGVGGQLLAQLFGLGASALAEAGCIQPTSINYSSTNSLFAMGVVMATVLVSAIYPAIRASKSANPGLARAWKMPPADGDLLELTFPFTVSAYDITGVISFLAEHFRRHDDAGLGSFAASQVEISRTEAGSLAFRSRLALAPFDLGVTQDMVLTAVPSEIAGVDEVCIRVRRLSGATGDWYRANRVFIRDLRRQFLLWRTLSDEMIEHYRMETLVTLGADCSGQESSR
jgi:hypothetical protein